MRSAILSLCFIFLNGLSSFGQQSISGKVLNSTTHKPIQYANIGLSEVNIGTISNPDGSFSLSIPEEFLLDTLVISSIGFGSKKIPIQYLLNRKKASIYLNEKTITLNPVIISSKNEKPKTFELGNKDFKGGVLQTDTLYAGRSISLLIQNTEANSKKGIVFPAFIEKAKLRIFRNNLRAFKYRIRINEVDSVTGLPGKDLLDQSIVRESSMRNGWLEFDLSDLNLQMTGPFFVTFEQLLDLTDRTLIANDYYKFLSEHPDKVLIDTFEVDGRKEVRKIFKGNGIDLAGTFVGIAISKTASEKYTCFVRETSLGEWKKVKGIVAATVSFSSYPDIVEDKKDENECDADLAICNAKRVIKDFMELNGVNGVQISVSKRSKMIWSEGFGYADILNKIPVTVSTKFRINSISKSVTSLALLKLVSEEKLNLDAPIATYLPEFPKKPFSFTTRQLAGHLAGFRDYDENDLNDYIRTEHYENSIEALKVFENDTLLFEPGTQFSYSTFGWNLIGAIIEKLSGKDYLTFMSENIFMPLHLENTCGDNVKVAISNRSKFYDITGEENDLGDWSYKYAGGGLLSTSEDLVKLGNEILYGSYIDTKLKKSLFQTQYTSDHKETGYGLGWYIGKDKNEHRIWYHAGDSFSGSSFLLIYPDDGLVLSFLVNSQIGAAFDIEGIAEFFYRN